jgi:hypothetical protein
MQKKNSIVRDQKGLVSIVVTLVFVSIISVVVLSFAFLVRREQQQALDRQLSTEAFYAAESGISEAVAGLKDGSIDTLSNCDDTTSAGITFKDKQIGDNSFISCVLVNRSPSSLEYTEIPTDRSQLVRLTSNGNSISSIEISWQSTDPADSTFSSDANFGLPTAGWSGSFAEHTGIVRTELFHLNGAINRGLMSTNVTTFFLYPLTQGPNPNSIDIRAPGTDGAFVTGDCDAGQTPKKCKSVLNNVNATTAYLRLKALYQPVNLSIVAYNGDGVAMPIEGEQAVIDSTGKAGSVLRRVQVRVPLRTDYEFPEFALETADDICKRLEVLPTTTNDKCTE